MELHLKIVGCLLIILAGMHLFFPKYFNWKTEFNSLSLVNRQMIYVHCFFVALILLLTGVLCITSAKQMVSTSIGKRIALGLAIFWFSRLMIQFFGYSSKLWKGKALESAVHILFSIFWIYMTLVFIAAFVHQR
jgi:hypothetical protein